ncbi:MAG: hypothetical protein SOX32_05990 [Candidatus Choladocola sp.]|nr:hypothetical protein [Candidatus Choladocola sp.]
MTDGCSGNKRAGTCAFAKIRDSYEKIVIALECDFTQTQDGIKIIRAVDFLPE